MAARAPLRFSNKCGEYRGTEASPRCTAEVYEPSRNAVEHPSSLSRTASLWSTNSGTNRDAAQSAVQRRRPAHPRAMFGSPWLRRTIVGC